MSCMCKVINADKRYGNCGILCHCQLVKYELLIPGLLLQDIGEIFFIRFVICQQFQIILIINCF